MWDLIPRERLSNLLRDPFGRRVRCHVNPDKLSPNQPDNDQYVELGKADGWNHQQILADAAASASPRARVGVLHLVAF
jgi:hypothetical protein